MGCHQRIDFGIQDKAPILNVPSYEAEVRDAANPEPQVSRQGGIRCKWPGLNCRHLSVARCGILFPAYCFYPPRFLPCWNFLRFLDRDTGHTQICIKLFIFRPHLLGTCTIANVCLEIWWVPYGTMNYWSKTPAKSLLSLVTRTWQMIHCSRSFCPLGQLRPVFLSLDNVPRFNPPDSDPGWIVRRVFCSGCAKVQNKKNNNGSKLGFISWRKCCCHCSGKKTNLNRKSGSAHLLEFTGKKQAFSQKSTFSCPHPSKNIHQSTDRSGEKHPGQKCHLS